MQSVHKVINLLSQISEITAPVDLCPVLCAQPNTNSNTNTVYRGLRALPIAALCICYLYLCAAGASLIRLRFWLDRLWTRTSLRSTKHTDTRGVGGGGARAGSDSSRWRTPSVQGVNWPCDRSLVRRPQGGSGAACRAQGAGVSVLPPCSRARSEALCRACVPIPRVPSRAVAAQGRVAYGTMAVPTRTGSRSWASAHLVRLRLRVAARLHFRGTAAGSRRRIILRLLCRAIPLASCVRVSSRTRESPRGGPLKSVGEVSTASARRCPRTARRAS